MPDLNQKSIFSVPRVGTGVMILKDGRILLGKRTGSHGTGEYGTPGGHLEYMESFEDCVRREVREECGLELGKIKFLYLANLKIYTPKHYVQLGFIADWVSGEPQILEPEKCESWSWYDLDNLPSPLFGTTKMYVEAYRTGRLLFDA